MDERTREKPRNDPGLLISLSEQECRGVADSSSEQE